ncbi:MAG: fibronectin type III domain-containing protein [Trebonia sp.]
MGAAGLSLTGVSLDGTTFSSSVALTDDWGGQVLYVAGATADTSPPLTVTVGSEQCAVPPTLTGPSSSFDVACVLPVLPTGQTFDVTVGMGGQTATLTNALGIPPQPTVSNVSGCASDANGSTSLCPTGGGVSLTITGTGFGDAVVALIGGQVCPNLVVTSATALTCILPPGSGTQPLTIATGLGVVPTTLTVGYAPPPSLPAPTNVAAVPGDGTATITWSTAADPTATAFRVTPSAGGATLPSVTFSVPAGGAPATMSVQIAGLANGVPTTFTVAAVDGSQVGTESTPSAPIVPSGLPSAPTGITTQKSRGHLTLSWAAPSNDGGSALTGYTVTPYLNGVAQPTISVPADATSTKPMLPNGTYVFEVSAANARGNGPASAPSAPAHIP